MRIMRGWGIYTRELPPTVPKGTLLVSRVSLDSTMANAQLNDIKGRLALITGASGG